MKIKMIYQIGAFYYEAECLNEQERKEAIKGLIYATKDLNEAYLLGNPQTSESVAVSDNYDDVEDNSQPAPQPVVEYATPGQRDYMTKLGIPFNDYTTKIEAIDMINNWKTQHGIPINGKKI